MSDSPIGSPMLQARGPLVLDLPEQAWFDVQLMHKDIRLALEAARETRVPVPTASAADRGADPGRGAGLRPPRYRLPVPGADAARAAPSPQAAA